MFPSYPPYAPSTASQLAGLLGSGLFLLIIVAVFLAFKMRHSFVSGPTLVLRTFSLKPAGTGGAVLDIDGRASGLVAWILTTMGLDTQTRLTVTDAEVRLRTTNLSGELHERVPLREVASTACAYSQPLWVAVLGSAYAAGSLLIAMLSSDGSAVFWGLLVGAAAWAYYAYQKKLAIVIETSGGKRIGVAFKRSFVESVQVDVAHLLRAIEAVNAEVLKAKGHAVI